MCLDSQFIYLWICSVHNLSVNDHSIHNPSGLQHVSVGTGCFEMALMYYSELLPTVFFLKFDFSVHVMAEEHTALLCYSFFVTSGANSAYLEFYSLQEASSSSVDAQDQLDFPDLTCMIHANPADYNSVVLNQLFPLAGEVLLPKADCPIQTQCDSFWNDDKELCLPGHCDFYACDAVDSSSSHVQVLDANLQGVFNSNTSISELGCSNFCEN